MADNTESKPTVVTVRFPGDVYDRVKAAAEKNRRSISAQIIFMVEEQMRANA